MSVELQLTSQTRYGLTQKRTSVLSCEICLDVLKQGEFFVFFKKAFLQTEGKVIYSSVAFCAIFFPRRSEELLLMTAVPFNYFPDIDWLT